MANTDDPRRGLPPRPLDSSAPEAWRRYAEELEAVIAAGEGRANFLHGRLNQIVSSPAWKVLRKARGLLAPASRAPAAKRAAPRSDSTELPLFHPVIQGQPLVSILIPFRDGARFLARCLDSIRKKTEYKNYEFVLLDNGSAERSTLKLLAREKSRPHVTILRIDEPFNYSRLNNRGAEAARGEYLLLLNNDTEVLAPAWLNAMLEHSQRPEVGAVGAKLLYPGGLIQHAGVVPGQDDVAGHAFHLCPAGEPGAQCVRNCAAVTGACLMTRKALFEELGGMNETDLAVAYGDVDYCLRLRERGLLVVYTPHAALLHHESLTRSLVNDPRAAAYMCRRWAREILAGEEKVT